MRNIPYQKGFSVYRKYYSRHLGSLVKSKQATAYMMIVLSLFTISFFGIFAIRPTVKTIVELNRQIEDAQKVNETLQKKIDTLVRAQEEYQLIKEFVPAIDEALPNKPNLATVVTKIENLANEKEATVSALSVGKIVYKQQITDDLRASPQNTTDAVSIGINLTLDGTYVEFASFLNSLFKMRRTVTSDNLTLAIGGSSAVIKLSLGLDLNSYYLKK